MNLAVETADLPTGLIAFLISDVEGSTELVQVLGDHQYQEIIERHNQILEESIRRHSGRVVHVTGDSFFAVFVDPLDAVVSAADVQRRLSEERWRHDAAVRVRMGLHVGAGRLGGQDYVGLDVHRAARISSAAHGGQVLLSAEMARPVSGRLPPGLQLRDLGRHRLKDLSQPEELFQLVVHGLDENFPAIRSLIAPSSNLPTLETSFVGRGEQADIVARLLSAHRVVTLTGPGGTGKTRLAIHIASNMADGLRNGAHFVDLASVFEESLVSVAILKALNRPVIAADPDHELLAFLSNKELLLVLDNYEQLLPELSVVKKLLEGAPGIRLIVTSRTPLRLGEEVEFQVPPLPIPRVDGADGSLEELGSNEAVRLFVERAKAANPSFQLRQENAGSVARLVSYLEGLPLALELAASRARLMTPEEMVDRLSLQLLASTSAELPKRQRTIAGAIEWSYNLLPISARHFFERFSVFQGGAKLADVESVLGRGEDSNIDILEDLAVLVDHSLIKAVTIGPTTRYQMLAVVREYAEQRLTESGESEHTRDRHLKSYASLARMAEPFLLTSHQRKWLDILTVEHDNLRAAHDWAIESEATETAHELAGDLWRFWQRRGHLAEGENRIEKTLRMPDASPMARARALEALGGIRYWRGDWEGAVGPWSESLSIVRELGEPDALADALYNASFASNVQGNPETARTYLEQALALYQELDKSLGVGRAYWGLCDLAFLSGDPQECIRWAKEAELIFESLDAPFDLGWARFMIGHASYISGDIATARQALDAALPLFIDAEDVSAFVLVTYAKAGVLESEGNRLAAAHLLGALEVLVKQSGAGIGEVEANRYASLLALREDPDPDIQQAVEEGRALGPEQVIELAIST